jgi:hypothetical protein
MMAGRAIRGKNKLHFSLHMVPNFYLFILYFQLVYGTYMLIDARIKKLAFNYFAKGDIYA